ncbi:hypothetical protein [Nocardia sp. NPDC024068]|uniref:hypothetical protein n=1 Tax=Nocardia sp. NPDC024068 TaxID=3157197 RepID=UPI0034005C47
MSETKDPRRTRRKSSRTAGPPVEGAPVAATEKAGSSEAAAEASASAASADRAETPTEKVETDTVGAAAGKAEADKAEFAAEPAGEDTAKLDAPTERVAVAVGGDKAAEPTVALDKPAGKATTETPGAVEAESESGDTDTAKSGRPWKRIVALAAAAVLVIGLVGAAVVSTIAVQSTQQRDERRAEYVATARQTILNLTTIRADTAKEDIDRILTMASGEFKTEFDGRVDPFTEIVKQAKVVSTGEVVESAVERDDENSAVVLIAAKQTLTNAGAQDQQQRFYRFRVTVSRADDGSLTASDVKFVA